MTKCGCCKNLDRLDFVSMLGQEYMCACVCGGGGGISRVLAGRKWRTLRFGYEQLESIEGELKRERKKIAG